MKSLTRNLLIGSLTAALTMYGARVVLAGPSVSIKNPQGLKTVKDFQQANKLVNKSFLGKLQFSKNQGPKGPGPQDKWGKWPKGPKGPWIDPGFHPWKHHHPHYLPPVYVGGMTTYYEPAVANPVPPADIQLINPPENRVTLKYRLDDGELQSLPAGYSVQINQAVVISFDRGGYAGRARYSLTDGAFKFVAKGRMWDLVRQPAAGVETASYAGEDANPVPGN